MNRIFLATLLMTAACGDKNPDAGPGLADTGSDATGGDGCVRINGTGGWPTIKSALAEAVDGDVIYLCPGTYEEKVKIEKAVTIKGPNTGDPAIIVGPEGDSAVSIRTDGVTLSWITIQSHDMGVYVRDVRNTLIQAVTVNEVVGPAIRAAGSTDMLVQACHFDNTPASAILIDGAGTATLLNNSFEGSVGYAVRAKDGATLTLDGNEFAGTVENDAGFNTAVRVTEGATSISTNNIFSENTGYGFHADGGHIQSDGDTFIGGQYAIYSTSGSIDVNNASITAAIDGGIRARTAADDLVVRNSTLAIDPTLGTSLTPDEWRSNTSKGVGLHLSTDADIRVEGLNISGFNNAGLFLAGLSSTTGPDVTVQDVTITNTGWVGLYGQEASFGIDNLTVTDLREVDDLEAAQCETVGTNGALNLSSSTGTITNSTFTDNDGYGIAALASDIEVSDVTVARNACSGIINFNGTLSVDDSDFSEPTYSELNASVVGYEAEATSVTNSRFVDGASITEYAREEYDFGTSSTTYVYTGRVGNDIRFFGGGENTVDGNTFEAGAQGVFAYESAATIQNNSWSDYSQFAAYFLSGVGTSTFTNNTFENSAGSALLCESSTVIATENVVERTISGAYGSYEVLVDGVSSGTYADTTASYPGVQLTNCQSTISNFSFNETAAIALYASGGALTADTVTISSPGYDSLFSSSAVTLDGSTSPLTADINGLTVTDQGIGSALSMEGDRFSESIESSLVATDVSISGSEGYGVELYNSQVELINLSVSGTAREGVYAYSSDVTVDSGVIAGSTAQGVYANDANITVKNVLIQYNGTHGIEVSTGTLTATDNTVKGNGQNGIDLTDTELSDLSGNIISTNEGYGLHCGGSSFAVCDNEISGNLLGPTDDCDSACGFEDPVEPGDTDAGETDGGSDTGGETTGDTEGGSGGETTGDTEGGSGGETTGDTEGGSSGDTVGGSSGDTVGGSSGDTEGGSGGETTGDAGGGSGGESPSADDTGIRDTGSRDTGLEETDTGIEDSESSSESATVEDDETESGAASGSTTATGDGA